MPLTNTGIKFLKAKDRDYKVADERGLFLLVMANSTKCWRFSYRYDNKQKSLSMGIYPDTSLKLAREKRDEARQTLAQGMDPSAVRKELKAIQSGKAKNSLNIITAYFLDMKKTEWNPAYFSKVEARLKKDVLPALGTMPITDIKAPDILRVLHKVEARGTIESAHRIKETLSQIFRYAIASGLADKNPIPDLAGALRRAKEKHMAAITDPEQAGDLLRQIDAYQGTFPVICALKLAPLVFVRPGELRQAEWANINFECAEWRFKASKTYQDHIVPLSRQAVAILKALQPYTGHGRYVFPSNKSDALPMSSNTILSALRVMGFEKDKMSGHGFRAMARTMIAERLRYPDVAIELQLAHQVRDIHGHAYNRASFLDDRKRMMQEWADYLDKLKRDETGLHS
ncbi:MAG: integrase arm-type DNA-binding domain-containing protein [bacterium]|nr:integrase arm-type DNA-binding domain-containing protein [bacterium]